MLLAQLGCGMKYTTSPTLVMFGQTSLYSVQPFNFRAKAIAWHINAVFRYYKRISIQIFVGCSHAGTLNKNIRFRCRQITKNFITVWKYFCNTIHIQDSEDDVLYCSTNSKQSRCSIGHLRTLRVPHVVITFFFLKKNIEYFSFLFLIYEFST